MTVQLDSEFQDIRAVLDAQMRAVMKALDDALARQPATNERKDLMKRLGKAMSRHLYTWEQELKTDSLGPLADALEDVLE